jgi:hypothetical protein
VRELCCSIQLEDGSEVEFEVIPGSHLYIKSPDAAVCIPWEDLPIPDREAICLSTQYCETLWNMSVRKFLPSFHSNNSDSSCGSQNTSQKGSPKANSLTSSTAPKQASAVTAGSYLSTLCSCPTESLSGRDMTSWSASEIFTTPSRFFANCLQRVESFTQGWIASWLVKSSLAVLVAAFLVGGLNFSGTRVEAELRKPYIEDAATGFFIERHYLIK